LARGHHAKRWINYKPGLQTLASERRRQVLPLAQHHHDSRRPETNETAIKH
jgi:hypothetical protein